MKAILALVEASASALLVKVGILDECSNSNGELNSFLKYDHEYMGYNAGKK